MKIFLSFIIGLCMFKGAYSQKADTSSYCSNVINTVSYYWRVDSLANNGFRLYAYRDLLKSKIDKVTRTFLQEKLGKPNKVTRTNHGTEYLYYYYDSKEMPKEFGNPFEIGYISFRFGEYDKYLTAMSEGVFDY